MREQSHAVGRSCVIVIYLFSIRVPRTNDGSPVECESCTSGGSPLSCCRPSQSPMVDSVIISREIYEDYACDFPCFKAIFDVLYEVQHLGSARFAGAEASLLWYKDMPGPDGLHPRVLKELSNEISKPLAIIMQISLDEHTVPQNWKYAHVSPILKKGSKSSMTNYRPISLTSVICKQMEAIIKYHLMEYI